MRKNDKLNEGGMFAGDFDPSDLDYEDKIADFVRDEFGSSNSSANSRGFRPFEFNYRSDYLDDFEGLTPEQKTKNQTILDKLALDLQKDKDRGNAVFQPEPKSHNYVRKAARNPEYVKGVEAAKKARLNAKTNEERLEAIKQELKLKKQYGITLSRREKNILGSLPESVRESVLEFGTNNAGKTVVKPVKYSGYKSTTTCGAQQYTLDDRPLTKNEGNIARAVWSYLKSKGLEKRVGSSFDSTPDISIQASGDVWVYFDGNNSGTPDIKLSSGTLSKYLTTPKREGGLRINKDFIIVYSLNKDTVFTNYALKATASGEFCGCYVDSEDEATSPGLFIKPEDIERFRTWDKNLKFAYAPNKSVNDEDPMPIVSRDWLDKHQYKAPKIKEGKTYRYDPYEDDYEDQSFYDNYNEESEADFGEDWDGWDGWDGFNVPVSEVSDDFEYESALNDLDAEGIEYNVTENEEVLI